MGDSSGGYRSQRVQLQHNGYQVNLVSAMEGKLLLHLCGWRRNLLLKAVLWVSIFVATNHMWVTTQLVPKVLSSVRTVSFLGVKLNSRFSYQVLKISAQSTSLDIQRSTVHKDEQHGLINNSPSINVSRSHYTMRSLIQAGVCLYHPFCLQLHPITPIGIRSPQNYTELSQKRILFQYSYFILRL
jgi:hypothetical protein